MEYRWYGSSSPGQHCSHCPKSVIEICSLNCGNEYQKLQADRKADGCIVKEICENRPSWANS